MNHLYSVGAKAAQWFQIGQQGRHWQLKRAEDIPGTVDDADAHRVFSLATRLI
ncbi:hypothetical protein HBO13_30755 [Pseudomonas lactis]|uniref:Uncharacterized protein n=1 Tax=Pseudomonas lactis TaxID=1615674 RepID=A0A7Y1M876_9PSED|nr:hypothetical protein [Pseudomonas lactis]NNA77018.1 hypothetical protein [Pseudomonas lactis]